MLQLDYPKRKNQLLDPLIVIWVIKQMMILRANLIFVIRSFKIGSSNFAGISIHFENVLIVSLHCSSW